MRVLVVEDYAPVRTALCQGLSEAGYAVDSAASGTDGLWFAQTSQFDVIILDLMLPGMDGFAILRKLREVRSAVSVLLLTAKDKVEDRVKGLDLGADDYLIKPFEFCELLARVRALVRRRYATKNPLLRINDLEIDTVRRNVWRDNRRLDLTPREYALLEYLAHRPGEVVTRTDIWEHVYDFHSCATSNVVDVYIGYLRKKIDHQHLKKLIHTRRGHGYVLGEAP